MDVTQGKLINTLLWIAIPAVAQAILSNFYAFNDFLFVGHIKDKAEANNATSALSAAIGIQIICFSLHNLIPSGAQTYIAQFYGAKRYDQVKETIKSGFYACLLFSTLVSVIGQLLCPSIASISNSNREVSDALESFLSIILLASPAFGLMLLVDVMYKGCGNTRTPLALEIMSLLLNTALNYIFVIVLNHGIQGTAIATAISRFIPALIGLYGILHNWIPNVNINLNDLITFHSMKDNNNGIELVTVNQNQDEHEKELILEVQNIDITENRNYISYLSDMMMRSFDMAKLGAYESLGDFLYGYVFTCMIRYAGLLGAAQQAGLGAGMRGVEWLAFCVSEGFLISAISCVGQNIGAGFFERAMHAALLCSFLSAFVTGLIGVPFIFYSKQLSSMLSTDENIIKYSSQYVFLNGFVMSSVGFEMASYGAMIGAGKAKIICYVNGCLNVSRIFIVAICLIGGIRHEKLYDVIKIILWVIGLQSQPPSKEVITGDFECICYAVAGTCIVKSTLFLIILSYRYFSKLYFSDCKLIDNISNINNENDNNIENDKYKLIKTIDDQDIDDIIEEQYNENIDN